MYDGIVGEFMCVVGKYDGCICWLLGIFVYCGVNFGLDMCGKSFVDVDLFFIDLVVYVGLFFWLFVCVLCFFKVVWLFGVLMGCKLFVIYLFGDSYVYLLMGL